ncbi:endonuclease NucS [Canibacter sp. lx-72]|uniref:endonuclease NucS n=1 Tax=Canibacter zhuwentaonis TaxID=2837491 RepID=UPI001BDD9D8E|nr:endonuclease NucS [Canibacter zhuwentaonis]MBT1035391.1 endonuclease NucS [Canibacter zhuwentaonis]
MKIIIAKCSVDYTGRITSHLPLAARMLIFKADGSVQVHSDVGSYKPLNWMKAPLTLFRQKPDEKQAADGVSEILRAEPRRGKDLLLIYIHHVYEELEYDLGDAPALIKDGVEKHLQELLAEQIELLGEGYSLIRREHSTSIGPVDILAKDASGQTVAVEIKRRGEIDGVEQLTRYLAQLNKDPLFAPVSGIFAAQEIKPQASTLAADRGIRCVVLDYDKMRNIEDVNALF